MDQQNQSCPVVSEAEINYSARFTGVKILAKIHKLMANNPYIQKDIDSKELKYKYVSTAAVMDKIQPSLIELGLVAIPEYATLAESNYATAKGAIWKYVRTRLTMQVADVESGEYCTAVCEGSGTDPGDKAVAKAQTMAQKNIWCKLLNIPIGNDPEADPRTDQQQLTPAVGYGFPQYEQEIVSCWQSLGQPWDVNQIPSYIHQRYGRPPAQLTVEECYALWVEFYGYLQQKQGGQTV